MNTSSRIFLCLCWLVPVLGFSQQSLQLRLKLINSQRWGVYVRPMDNIAPSTSTITAQAQVTVVMPKQYEWDSLKSVHGTWGKSMVHGPTENPTRSYVSFYLISDAPKIPYVTGQETLLFTIKKKSHAVPCPDSLYLINNATDPFNQLPNSQGSNPGTAFTVLDINYIYEYHSNYALSGWSCKDNDGDHYPNGVEDTNGDGDFDPGIDTTDLNVIENGLDLKLQLIAEDKWGVFVRPMDNLYPSLNTQVAAAQVTVVMPKNYAWNNLVSVHGTWTANARIDGPTENPTKTYYSFNWVTEYPHVDFINGQETLLFTFKMAEPCPDSIYLINNTDDPFLPPNSQNANVGNDLVVWDPIGAIYAYRSNYSPAAWNCHDNDGDGVLNAFEDTDGDGQYDANNEDTNGNGQLDPGEDADGDGYLDPDASDLNDPCDPGQLISANLSAVAGTEVICANDPDDIAFIKVDITGGTPPYEVSYTDGQDTFFVYNYHSGDNIPVVPSHSVQLQLVGIAEASACSQNTVLGGVANIAVHGPIAFNNHPNSVVECAGNGTSFCVTTLNLGDGYINYQWQVNDGSGWADLPEGGGYSQTTTACLSLANVAGLHGHQYRCRISTSVCDVIYSNAALVEVEGPLAFTVHPQDAVNCASEGVTFTASFGNGGAVGAMNHVWQYSSDGVNWFDLPNGAGPGGAVFGGATGSTSAQNGSSTLTLSNISPALDGAYFRLKVGTPECGFVHSNQARLNVEGPIAIIDQPADAEICNSAEAFLVAGFQNAGSGYPAGQVLTLTNYFWQVSTNGGTSWSNLTNSSGVYTGISGTNIGGTGTDTLTITNTSGLDGYQYRIAYTTPTCSVPVYSDAATLQANGNVNFTVHPSNITLCAGSDTVLIAAASIPLGTFSFGWEYSTDNGATWNAIDFVADAAIYSHSSQGEINAGVDFLTIHNSAGMYYRRFRAVAHSANCADVYSNYAILTVQGPLSVLDHPDDVVECYGNTAFMFAKIENQGVLYSTIVRWQVSIDNGITWFDLNNNAFYNGTNNINLTTGVSVLSISNVAFVQNYLYRLSYRTSACPVQYTNAARITVEGPLTVTQQPTDFTNCSGNEAIFVADVSNPGYGEVHSQWQMSADGGNTWWDLEHLMDTIAGNPVLVGGYDADTLLLSPITGLDGYKVRQVYWTDSCTGGVTNWATLHVEGPIAFTDQPDDLFLANGESGSLSIGAAISNGTLVYKWQYSTIQGLWIDVPSNGVFSGTDTPTLQVNGMTPAYNGRYRCMVKSAHCDWEASDFAYLAVGSIVNITSSPQNTSTCGGVSACFDAAVEAINNNNPTWELQWQKKDAMGNWLDLSNDATYSGTHGLHFCINNPNATHNGQYRFRARTNDSNWTISVTVSLSVNGPSFVQMPTSASVCSNKPHVFQASVSNAAGATLRWQRSTNGGASWVTLPSNAGSNAPFNNGTYSGAYGQNLTLSNVEGMDGHRFRLVANDAQCTVTSSPVLLDVKDACQSTACDYDNDGIVNEQDSDYDNCGSACLKLKLQFLPNSNGWAVMAKPNGSFAPTASTLTIVGRVTIVAPAGFALDGFESLGGTWSPTNVEENLPSYPGRKLITFELQDQQGVQIPYQVNQETPLFGFDKTGNCPDSLFILELVPLGIAPNILTGEDNGYAGGFELCGVYARGNWNCQSPNGGGFPGGPGSSVPVVDISAPEEGASERGVIANQAGTARFTASPNPAGDFVNIALEGKLAEGNHAISLWDLQGKQRQTLELNEQANVQLNLSGLPSGVYLVALSQNGRVVQREKVVVR